MSKGKCHVEVSFTTSLKPGEYIKSTIGFEEEYDGDIDVREEKYQELLELSQLKLMETMGETSKTVRVLKKALTKNEN